MRGAPRTLYLSLHPDYMQPGSKKYGGVIAHSAAGEGSYSVLAVNSSCKIAESIAASSSFSTVAHAPP